MVNEDIRWQQRFLNFQKAFHQLHEAMEILEKRPLTNLERQGFIQAFEYTHELAWKTMKDFLEYKGNTQTIYGSKDATREAFNVNLITHGEDWMRMINSRNLTSHTYNEAKVQEIIKLISNNYFVRFVEFKEKFQELQNQ